MDGILAILEAGVIVKQSDERISRLVKIKAGYIKDDTISNIEKELNDWMEFRNTYEKIIVDYVNATFEIYINGK